MIKKIKENLNFTFRALRHKNYQLFFSGQCISLVGTWMQQIAMSWLVYMLTKSPLIMGIITFSGSIPSLFISPFAGVIIDRIDKYKAMVVVQFLFMIEAFLLAALTLSGVIKVWHIVVLSIIAGLTIAFDMPLRQSFVVQLIEDAEDLGNAISLNSMTFNMARLIGPAIAGALVAAVGEGICFLLNALSYIAVIAALFFMTINYNLKPKSDKKHIFAELADGFSYAYHEKPIRNIILFLGATSFIGMSFPVLMPIFAKEILHGGAQTMGFLMSSSGVGALIGAIRLANKKEISDYGKVLVFAPLLFSLGLGGLAFVHNLWIALVLLFFTGFGMVSVMASCNTLIQHWVDEDKRGRVMSFYTMAFMGTAPLGSLFGGAIAEKIGVPDTFFLCGIGMVIIAIVLGPKLVKSAVKKEVYVNKL